MHIESPQWSGWNNAVSRRSAAQKIASELEQIVGRWPAALHYVVGHSHGGAIAMLAVNKCSTATRAKIRGIATIATPFIVIRPLKSSRADVAATLRQFYLLLLPGLLVLPFLNALIHHLRESPETDYSLHLLVAFSVAAVFVSQRGATIFARSDSAYAKRSFDLLDSNVPEGVTLLIVRASGDEASALLSASQLAAQGLRWAWSAVRWAMRPLTALSQGFERLGRRLRFDRWGGLSVGFAIGRGLLSLVSFVALLALTAHIKMELVEGRAAPGDALGQRLKSAFLGVAHFVAGQGASWDDASVDAIVVLATILVVPAVLLAVLLVACGTTLLPFGGEAVSAAQIAEISVEASPLGTWPVHLFSHRRVRRGCCGFKHSAYEELRLIQAVGDWIRADTLRPSSPSTTGPSL
ncbi:MAG: Mbeg1-like protein [Vicinamibacteraceae bacterium]